MRFISQSTSEGVSERLFTLGDITGVLWAPSGVHDAPAILIGHGGGQHKLAPGVVSRARRFAAGYGFLVAAIDAPGHGDRPRTAEDERFAAELRGRKARGESVIQQVSRHNADLAARAVPDWRATIDSLCDQGFVGGSVGYWGVSLGSAIGVPLVAAEPRIRATVLGLIGHETLADAASRITVPVEFLLQWHDELVPRESGLALFDAIGAEDKTLHANPGGHTAVPAFEIESAERFFVRHLVPATDRR